MTETRQSDSRADALAAVMTPEGRGAVATVVFTGDVALLEQSERPLFRAANGRTMSEQSLGRLVYGWWGAETAEEVVLCRTKVQTLEIHCHGGRAAARRILDDLESCGAAIVSAADLTEALVGTIRSECLQALSRAQTQRTADVLLEQTIGLLEATIQQMVDGLKPQTATAIPDDVRETLASLLQWSDFGRHLTQPWRVAVCGQPNVGKSSLINALVGFERSIVFDQPGTTRDVVTSLTALEGWPIELVDTAGIRETEVALESEGINRAKRALSEADCRVLLLDVSRPLSAEDAELLASIDDPILVAHKCDLPAMWNEQDVRNGRPDWDSNEQSGFLPVSAKTGVGVIELQRRIVRRIIPSIPPPGTALPVNERQIQLLTAAFHAMERGDLEGLRSTLAELLGTPRKNSGF